MTQVILPNKNMAGQANLWSHVEGNDQAIVDVVNGGLDNDNLNGRAGITADNLADSARLGISGASTVRRGKSIIATEEGRTNTAYGLLTTPDRVQNVVLPTDGLIFVAYEALVKGSANPANGTSIADAAIFIGSNQLKRQAATAPAVQAASISDDVGSGDTTNIYQHLHTVTSAQGLQSTTGNVASFVTTGMGASPIAIFAAAGTYDISVQFKAPSGTVTAKERKLWVWTVGF